MNNTNSIILEELEKLVKSLKKVHDPVVSKANYVKIPNEFLQFYLRCFRAYDKKKNIYKLTITVITEFNKDRTKKKTND